MPRRYPLACPTRHQSRCLPPPRPADAKAILREWCLERINYPYPTEAEKIQICIRTSLTLIQVNNWSVAAARTQPLHYSKTELLCNRDPPARATSRRDAV